jgi:phage repressor protein C with HTH and peptisase S24 domain
MFSHSEIWMAIDSLAKKHGYSTSGLAKKAGLDPTSFNKSKRLSAEGKPRWPSTESIAKILGITGSNMSDLTQLINTLQNDMVIHKHAASSVPVIGCAQAGNDGYFDDAGYPVGEGWDEVTLPTFSHEEQRVYALEVNGDSMLPLYRDGDVIVVAPDSDLRKGDRVVARTKKGEVLAKEMIRKTNNKIELKSLNPEHPDRTFISNEISWVARVIWVSQ